MKLSRKTDYGVMLVSLLKKSFETSIFVSLEKIAKENKLPLPFLEKLAESLRLKKILESRRGRSGGYRLLRDPKKITLKELIDIFEEPLLMRCMKSNDPEKHCVYAAMCPTREVWSSVQDRIYKAFESVTVDAL